jgi:Protein of unknown function (DUF2934)
MANGSVPLAITRLFEGEAARASGAAPKRAADELVEPAHGQIAALAYSYWEARGGRDGSPWEDWFRAERELRERQRPES